MADIQPPPTYADVVVVDTSTMKPRFNPIWLNWFLELAQVLNETGGTATDHNLLTGLQGGVLTEYYHLTSNEYTGSGTGVFARVSGPTFTAPNLGTPASGVATNLTGTAAGLSIGGNAATATLATTASAVAVGGITGLGAGVAAWLATPSSANLASAVTGETGSGALVFGTAPTLDLFKSVAYTVATLPAAPGAGARAHVTDATAPTYLGALTGGGAVVCPVFYNGTAWVSG